MLKTVSLDFENSLVIYVDSYGNKGSFHFSGLKDLSPAIIKIIGLELPDELMPFEPVTAEEGMDTALI